MLAFGLFPGTVEDPSEVQITCQGIDMHDLLHVGFISNGLWGSNDPVTFDVSVSVEKTE
jgi:hypothetical protein